MTTKQRYDSVSIKARFDSNGFLHDEPVIARIGIQEYMRADGTMQREFRPANEVFKAEAMELFRGMPIVEGHQEVSTSNARKIVVGSLSGAGRRDGIGLKCPIVIHDKESIESAKRGDAAELSVGYKTNDIHRGGWGNVNTGEYVFKDDAEGMESHFPNGTSMSDEWEEFDVLQTNIIPNHVAKVKRGRAGIARLNLDGSEEIKYDEHVKSTNEESEMTVKIKIDSAEVEVSKDVADHINKLQANAEKAGAKVDGLQAECDALKAKVDSIPDQIEKAVAKAKEDADKLASLVAVAAEAGVKVDGLDAKEIKVAYVKEVSGLDVAEKSDAYIDAAFDIAKDSDKMAEVRIKTNSQGKSDSKKDDGITLDPRARLNKLNK
jgi:uncharacterized protein